MISKHCAVSSHSGPSFNYSVNGLKSSAFWGQLPKPFLHGHHHASSNSNVNGDFDAQRACSFTVQNIHLQKDVFIKIGTKNQIKCYFILRYGLNLMQQAKFQSSVFLEAASKNNGFFQLTFNMNNLIFRAKTYFITFFFWYSRGRTSSRLKSIRLIHCNREAFSCS